VCLGVPSLTVYRCLLFALLAALGVAAATASPAQESSGPGGAAPSTPAEPEAAPEAGAAGEPPAAAPPPALEAVEEPPQPIRVAGREVLPGETANIILQVSESFAGTAVYSSVVVVRGERRGPTLCLTGGIHGDELNGTEAVRRALRDARTEGLRGTLIGVPIVNIHGFRRRTRYLPDRRDLNRHFPGSQTGSSASRIAYALFENVIRNCDALVDFHTGSFHRVNVSQVRGDLRRSEVLGLARSFGTAIVVHHPGTPGTLRRAATDGDIPAIVFEGGGPIVLERDEVERGARGVRNVMAALGMRPPRPPSGTDGVKAFFDSRWVRVDHGGIFSPLVRLGDSVEAGQSLATIFDPVGEERGLLKAPFSGLVIGMAEPQVVIPGFAAFHLAFRRMDDGLPADGVAPGSAASAEPEEEAGALDTEHPE